MTVPCVPNLPDNPVSTVICGQHPAVISALRTRGIEVITVQDCSDLPAPVANHADMICCHCGVNSLITADEILYRELKGRGVECDLTAAPLGCTYPDDVSLNCLVTGGCAVGRVASLDRNLIDYFDRNGFCMVDVRQGYARCSSAMVDEKSVITADRGIASALEANGFEVLLISPGGITLQGYDTGFIGGCCGKISADTMLFHGNVLTHPDGQRIIDFLIRREVKAECTCDEQLTDFGGFITLFQ